MAAAAQKRQDSLFQETADHNGQVQPIPPHLEEAQLSAKRTPKPKQPRQPRVGGAAAKEQAALVVECLQDQLEAVEDEEAIVS